MPEIETRLEKLEQSMNRWRRTAWVLALILVGLGTIGAAEYDRASDLIRTHYLEVVDREGQPIFSVGDLGGHGGIMTLYGQDAHEAFQVVPGRITLNNPEGQLIFAVERDGNQGAVGNGLMYLKNRFGDPIFMAGQVSDERGGYGFLQVHNRNGMNTTYGPAHR